MSISSVALLRIEYECTETPCQHRATLTFNDDQFVKDLDNNTIAALVQELRPEQIIFGVPGAKQQACQHFCTSALQGLNSAEEVLRLLRKR